MGLLLLTTIVVNQTSGRPSDVGYLKGTWEKEVQNVLDHKKWPDIAEIDWEYVWVNRKRLSNKYGTRGYWGS